MCRGSVLQSDDSQYFIFHFFNPAPIPDPVVLLRFGLEWIVYHTNTPFLFDIGALSKNLIQKIFRISKLYHEPFFNILLHKYI